VAEFNRRFQTPAAQQGTTFTACPRRDLDLIFSLQFERIVNRDNTFSFQNLSLQIDKVPRWPSERSSLRREGAKLSSSRRALP